MADPELEPEPDLPVPAFAAAAAAADPGEDLLDHYPVEMRDRLRNQRWKYLRKGLSEADIAARIAQIADSLGFTPPPGSALPNYRAAQANNSHLSALRQATLESPTEFIAASPSVVAATPVVPTGPGAAVDANGLSDQLAARTADVLRFLARHGPTSALPVAKAIVGPDAQKSCINPLLHRMREQGLLVKSNTKIWSLADDSPVNRLTLFLRDAGCPHNAMEIAGFLQIPLDKVEEAAAVLYMQGILQASTQQSPSGHHLYYQYA